MNDHRQLNTPSPVVFPSASPTPKLYSTPSKKLPNVKSWQEIGVDSVPHIIYRRRLSGFHYLIWIIS
ncbi:uncharacterized protein B0P05DRAFT_561885 [Gilbertella persicaria]|uniref:Uncharacterized protein n=1 Tax=Rhizopus stolonifer TaxID=4846 RepID=A0A367IQ34_RHIST|nr:uncharacterized protein B0P05DRAFT_561885 [Gilbertella persicaria]KAI8053176.1 hypothetical protein B0P05DRAFT_561885 [Gilbertella persicaria]RCH79798.1 hypothetical protein CU098_004048 [Rhizopus stolonifer]